MKAFLDTSVLIASFYGDHPHHDASIELLLRFGPAEACCSVHSLAEMYSTLTGMPGARRIAPDVALLFLRDCGERLTLVSLEPVEYIRAIEACAQTGLSGGVVYDALHAQCALKAQAEVIYTWNTKDFSRIPAIATRVRQPDAVS